MYGLFKDASVLCDRTGSVTSFIETLLTYYEEDIHREKQAFPIIQNIHSNYEKFTASIIRGD